MATAGILTLGWLEEELITQVWIQYAGSERIVQKHRASHDGLATLLGPKNKGRDTIANRKKGGPYVLTSLRAAVIFPLRTVGPGDLKQPGNKYSIPPLRFQLSTLSVQFSLSVVFDSVTPWTASHQASLFITNSQSSLKLMSIESVMPSSHLIVCHPAISSSSIQSSHPLSSPFPPAPNPSQHQSHFQWISSLLELAKVLKFQL